MNIRTIALGTVILALSVGPLIAHSGVNNPTVLARMNGMSAIATASKTLAEMARGQVLFNPRKTEEAALEMARHAAAIPMLFDDPADDPKSEARSEIWVNFDDFAGIAQNLEHAALEAAEAGTRNKLAKALKPVFKTCTACHKSYRE